MRSAPGQRPPRCSISRRYHWRQTSRLRNGASGCLKRGQETKSGVDPGRQSQSKDRSDFGDNNFLCCVTCRFPITQVSDRIQVNERHQHVFANPHGYVYQIGCFSQAIGCLPLDKETDHFSWFPGYTWRIVVCGQCLTLLGWAFRSQGSSFFGLILDKLSEVAGGSA